MAEHYCRASFSIKVTAAEAALMTEVLTLDIDGLSPSELDGFYQLRSPEFRETFPSTDEDAFSGFRALFTDPQDPHPCFTMRQEDASASGGVTLGIYGDNIDVEALANILFAVCRSAHPIGFCFSYGCSKLRADEFGGGYALISNAGVVLRDTDSELRRALAEIEAEDGRPLVIAKRDNENGLDFWNNEHGFGRLADATVFSPAEAQQYDLPIADRAPEWLTMPPRFA